MKYSPNEKREIIMNHYTSPKHLGKLKNTTIIYSDLCVDELHLGLEIKDNIIIDAKWDGKGCAIFKASTDIFIDQIINKNIIEVKEIIKEYQENIKGNDVNSKLLDKLIIFNNVSKDFNREHCASMIIRALKKALD